jgi:hypothetical protein
LIVLHVILVVKVKTLVCYVVENAVVDTEFRCKPDLLAAVGKPWVINYKRKAATEVVRVTVSAAAVSVHVE